MERVAMLQLYPHDISANGPMGIDVATLPIDWWEEL